jgi:hypothetical protein
LKKHNNSGKKSEPTSKRTKSRGPVQRDTKEVLAELVGKLKEKLDPKKVAARSAGEKHQSGELRPNLDRLTVGVDLGDQGSHYCILGLEGETLAEGQMRTTQPESDSRRDMFHLMLEHARGLLQNVVAFVNCQIWRRYVRQGRDPSAAPICPICD